MSFLLDTCVVSELTKERPNQAVYEWLGEQDEQDIYLSALTIGKLQRGVSKLPPGRRRDAMQRWLDVDLRRRFSGRILPITEDVAIAWGIRDSEAMRCGKIIPTIDGLLGATAIVYNLTLTTRNTKDFVETGARVFNPWND